MPDDRLDTLKSRLEWRVGGDWTHVDAHGEDALETVDDHGRRLRVLPGWGEEDDEMWVYGTVALVDHRRGSYCRQPTWLSGPTPRQAVEEARERLEEHLAAIAERRDEDPPTLRRRSGGEGMSTGEALEATAREQAAESADEADPEQKELL